MIRMLDDPAAEAEMGRFRMALEIGLRTSVGLLAAIALAFLLNYLDMSVRTRKEAEQLLVCRCWRRYPTAKLDNFLQATL